MKDSLKKLYNQHRSLNHTTLSTETKQALKTRILSKINNPQEEPKFQFSWSALFLKSYVIAPLALVLFISGATFTSAKSVPGDFLYPVKRAVEDVRLYVAPSNESKSNLEVRFAKERLEELEKLNDRNSQRSNRDDDDSDKPESSRQYRRGSDWNSDINPNHNNIEDDNDDFNDHHDQAQRNAEDAIKVLRDQRKKIEDQIERFESNSGSNNTDDRDDDRDNNSDDSSSGENDNSDDDNAEDSEDNDDNSGHGSDSTRDDSNENTSEN